MPYPSLQSSICQNKLVGWMPSQRNNFALNFLKETCHYDISYIWIAQIPNFYYTLCRANR